MTTRHFDNRASCFSLDSTTASYQEALLPCLRTGQLARISMLFEPRRPRERIANSQLEVTWNHLRGWRCDFYTPKDSGKAQLLESKENLQQLLASIPLTEDERAAVDDGQTAVDELLARLTDIPTPAGPTPRELGLLATVTVLPMVKVRQGKQGMMPRREGSDE